MGEIYHQKPRLSKEERLRLEEQVERAGDSWKCKLCDYHSDRKYKVKTHAGKPNVHLESTAKRLESQGIKLDGICSSMVEQLDGIWKCKNCDYKNKRKDKATQHVEKIHLNECSHECMLCGTKCKSRRRVICHISMCHIKEKTLSCQDCETVAIKKIEK